MSDHATHVAGLACARANNPRTGRNVVGVSWGCPVLSADSVDGSDLAVIRQMDRLANKGMQVVNMSLSSRLSYNMLPGNESLNSRCATRSEHEIYMQYMFNGAMNLRRAALDRVLGSANGRNVLWVVGAGNSCAPGVYSPWGLKAREHGNVLAVASVDSDGRLSSFSNWGPHISVAAPGGILTSTGRGPWSTDIGGHYASSAGTSMAAPVVSGVAALVRSAHPSLNAVEIAACIRSTASRATGSAEERSDITTASDYGEPGIRLVNHPESYSPIPIVDAYEATRCASQVDTASAAQQRISAGSAHTCAIPWAYGRVACWGDNTFGQTGAPLDEPKQTEPVYVPFIRSASGLASGQGHNCAISGESRAVFCWGSNMTGQLGAGHWGDVSRLPFATGLTDVIQLAAGESHTCALTADRTVWCWGLDAYGQVGDGPDEEEGPPFKLSPTQLQGLTDVQTISAGGFQTCAQRTDGSVRCWGSLDQTPERTNYVPTQIDGIDDARSVHIGFQHGCALREGGTISCWGDTTSNQLGADYGGEVQLNPQALPLPQGPARFMAATPWGGCMTSLYRTSQCWGHGQGRLIETGTPPNVDFEWSIAPFPVSQRLTAVAYAGGEYHRCMIDEGAQIYCWGENGRGQLGIGSTSNRTSPAQVNFPPTS